jgi:hypothetical protein
MEALNPSPVASGRGVHEELSRLHPQADDGLTDVLPDPFFLPRIKVKASEVDILEVVARCPRTYNPHVYGCRFETLRFLGAPCNLTDLAEAIMNAEVPPCVASFLASATLIPLDKLVPEQRRNQEQELRDQKGTLRPNGTGSVLVRFLNRALLAVIGKKILNGWLLATNLGSASAAGLRSYNSWFEPRLTPHRAGRTCKAMHLTRSTSSRSVPCLRKCLQIPRFVRYSASRLCYMAVYLPGTFVTH